MVQVTVAFCAGVGSVTQAKAQAMQLSDRGANFIVNWEGLERKLPDGRYASYRDVINGKTDVWTIFCGCTEGIRADTVWTHDEGMAAFKKEIATHEHGVERMVTVELNQNEFDALVSTSYNIGSHALANSTIIRKLNAGNRHGAADAFLLWNKFGGKPVKGLTARRRAESALFLEPVEGSEDDTAVQTPEQAPAPPSHATVGTAGAVGGATLLGAAQNLPDLSALNNIQSTGSSIHGFLSWLTSSPLEVGCVIIVVAAVLLLPRLRKE